MLWPRLERDRNISRTENVGQDPPRAIYYLGEGESLTGTTDKEKTRLRIFPGVQISVSVSTVTSSPEPLPGAALPRPDDPPDGVLALLAP